MAYPRRTREPHEVFGEFTQAKSRAEKIDVLKKNQTAALTDILRGFFDDRVQWHLPAGAPPPYTPNVPQSVPSSLLKQHLNFKYLVKGIKTADDLPPFKREKLFIDMLEVVHPEDAKILVSMINKKSPVKGLTKKIAQEAYPNLIPD
jgi:hypothetical protein|tara:strand:- start:2897 stop:3337 length:441 start_codon:yes stop_codon:yes gene_type:complete